MTARESSLAIGRSQIGDRDNFHVVGWVLADQDVAFVTGPDKGNSNRVTFELFVTEVERPQPGSGSGSSLHEIPSRNSDDLIEVVFSDLFLFWRQQHFRAP